ncbi:hypothetical protein GOBAR_AA03983 [Gossypium barbadense]|uniref:Uncharacterized protein n=1 Tax=Gossypium barbadense TaxID=3634 RepID=A0A2P5YLV5_GOSBA|nr:hypothetical protein GOBAR_AA03983 [Gossypium barbadense]
MEEEHAQSSLPSNTEPNPREQLNTINVQDEEGFVEPEPEPRQETVVSRGQGEEVGLKEVQEPFSSCSRGPIHEDRMLQIEELDEWRTHKPRTHNKPKLRQNELNTFPNQHKVGDKVLLDAVDPHIVLTKLNEEIPLTVYNVVFTRKEDRCPCFKEKEGSIIFFGSCHENSPPFSSASSASQNDLDTLNLYIHHSPSWCWDTLVPGSTTYNPSHSKALALPPSLTYLHAILAHTLTGRQESTGVVNTHDAYFLWCMSHGHVTDLAYFIALAIQHQTEWHTKGVISIGPYVTQLARHFGLLDTAAQESSLTLIGKISPQGISSMLSMRMIEKRRGTYPPQYRLAQSTEEEAPEDITDDVPPQHDDVPPHSTRTRHLSHHHPLVQFMLRLHMLTFLSTSLDLSSNVFNDLTTLKLLYSRTGSGLETPQGKVLHDSHVLLNHDRNQFQI